MHLSGRPGDTRKLPHPHPTPPLHCLKLLLLFSCQVMSSSLQSHGLQAPLSFTVSPSLLRFISIESVMLSNHFILCQPFSFCLQSLSASACFPMSQLFTSVGQSLGASASVLLMNIKWTSTNSSWGLVCKYPSGGITLRCVQHCLLRNSQWMKLQSPWV